MVVYYYSDGYIFHHGMGGDVNVDFSHYTPNAKEGRKQEVKRQPKIIEQVSEVELRREI